jgi:hypothetical protein
LWLLLLLPAYVGWRLSPALTIAPFSACAAVALLVILCVVIPRSVRNHALRNSTLERLVAWAGVLSMGFFSSLLVFTVLRDLVLHMKTAPSESPGHSSAQPFFGANANDNHGCLHLHLLYINTSSTIRSSDVSVILPGGSPQD